MFTPQEVSEKTFPKASGFNNGYGMAAVDEFLDALTEDERKILLSGCLINYYRG